MRHLTSFFTEILQTEALFLSAANLLKRFPDRSKGPNLKQFGPLWILEPIRK